MILKEKLRTVKMQKGENVTPCLTRIQGVIDELEIVGEKQSDSELVSIDSTGLPRSGIHSSK